MSYCRWSNDGFQCDVYVYESVYDCFTIHVAGRRHTNDEIQPPKAEDFEHNPDGWIAYHNATREWIDHPGTYLKDIDGSDEFLGETFDLPTAAECADKLEEIRAGGFNVPQYAIDALREEA